MAQSVEEVKDPALKESDYKEYSTLYEFFLLLKRGIHRDISAAKSSGYGGSSSYGGSAGSGGQTR